MPQLPASNKISRPSNQPPRALFLAGSTLLALVMALAAVWQFRGMESEINKIDAEPTAPQNLKQDDGTPPSVTKSDAEWRAQLTPEQYEVTRHKATERPFTGAYWDHKEAGTYTCIGCGAELFTSDGKYDSGCGWPSFFAAGKPENLQTHSDHSLGMIRTEVVCKNCGAHLGHLFDDGPAPTGQRYCINSASMGFAKADEKPSEQSDASDKKPSPTETPEK